MKDDITQELLYHIIAVFGEKHDSRQLLNMIEPTKDGYILNAYSKTLRFNKDGDIIDE